MNLSARLALAASCLVLVGTPALARSSSRPLQKDAVLLADTFVNDQIDGAKDVKECLRKFKTVASGVDSGTVSTTGGEDENSVTFRMIGIPKSERRHKPVLSITNEEGSVTCEVEE